MKYDDYYKANHFNYTYMCTCTESKGLLKLIVSFFKPFGLIDVIRFHGVVKGAQNMKFKPYGIEIEP